MPEKCFLVGCANEAVHSHLCLWHFDGLNLAARNGLINVARLPRDPFEAMHIRLYAIAEAYYSDWKARWPSGA